LAKCVCSQGALRIIWGAKWRGRRTLSEGTSRSKVVDVVGVVIIVRRNPYDRRQVGIKTWVNPLHCGRPLVAVVIPFLRLFPLPCTLGRFGNPALRAIFFTFFSPCCLRHPSVDPSGLPYNHTNASLYRLRLQLTSFGSLSIPRPHLHHQFFRYLPEGDEKTISQEEKSSDLTTHKLITPRPAPRLPHPIAKV
jgi:hypothetical protein